VLAGARWLSETVDGLLGFFNNFLEARIAAQRIPKGNSFNWP